MALHHRSTILAFTFISSLAAAPGASAQSTDSVTFRPGQWGAEFTAGTQFSSAGVLRFRSPNAAWIADLSASVSKRSGDVITQSTGNSFSLRVGSRWYHSLGPRVKQFATLGVVGYGNSTRVETLLGITQKTSSWGGGAFGNLGAAWFVVPRLSLAATWEASATYGNVKSSGTSQQTSNGHDTIISLGGAALRVGLYF